MTTPGWLLLFNTCILLLCHKLYPHQKYQKWLYDDYEMYEEEYCHLHPNSIRFYVKGN